MKHARTARMQISALGIAAPLAGAAFAKEPRSNSIHSYILLDRTGSMEPIWTGSPFLA